MDCEVARETLSARLDGEREPVPSARVDEHLDECGACGLWFEQVAGQASRLQRLIESRPVIGAVDLAGIRPTPQPRERKRMSWQRWHCCAWGSRRSPWESCKDWASASAWATTM